MSSAESRCPTCAAVVDDGGWQAHFSEVHLRYFPYNCVECDEWLSTSDQLNHHAVTKHKRNDIPIRRAYNAKKESELETMLSAVKTTEVTPSQTDQLKVTVVKAEPVPALSVEPQIVEPKADTDEDNGGPKITPKRTAADENGWFSSLHVGSSNNSLPLTSPVVDVEFVSTTNTPSLEQRQKSGGPIRRGRPPGVYGQWLCPKDDCDRVYKYAAGLRYHLIKHHGQIQPITLSTRRSRMPAKVNDAEGVTCHNCNQQGHISRDCPEERHGGGGGYGGGERSVTCYNCNKEGHISRDCPEQRDGCDGGGGGGGGGSRGYCFSCGQPGHMSRDCPGGGR